MGNQVVSSGSLGLTGIKGFLETSFLDWPGRICAVLFLGGCNFRCPYCHNPELVLAPHELEDVSWEKVKGRLLSLKGWVDGVCITGGEPTLHPRLVSLLEEIRGLGYEVKLDTNGSRPQVMEELLKKNLLSGVSMDLKAPLSFLPYRRAAGVDPPLEAISKSLEILGGSFLELEFRTTLVPGFLGEEEILQIASLLPLRGRYTLQGFRPGRTLEPSLNRMRAFPEEELERLRGALNRLGRLGVPQAREP